MDQYRSEKVFIVAVQTSNEECKHHGCSVRESGIWQASIGLVALKAPAPFLGPLLVTFTRVGVLERMGGSGQCEY